MFKPTPNPAGTLSPEEHEALATAAAEAAQSRGLEMIKSGGRIDVATGNQLLVTAAKHRAIAAQLAKQRVDRDWSAYLVEHEKQIKGLTTRALRPPLHRKGQP